MILVKLLCLLLLTLGVSVVQIEANLTSFNTGTVLFTPADVSRDCWSPENIALLTSRMLMSNVMPPVDRLKPTDNSFVTDIIDYFRLLLQVIRGNSSGRTKHVLLLAVTDTMGGYMKHLVLPICKYAYYAGKIEYASIIKLYQLQDELKNYLRTNGNGWAKAWKRAGKHVQAEALSLQGPQPTADPCRGIIYYRAEASKLRRENGAPVASQCSMEVPLPFFDSKTHPSAIAVPFKTFGLRNLESRVSAYILVKFYVAVSKCMASRNSNDDDVQKFNANFFAFVMNKVMPHLCDDKFYAAFGGVLRILETIKKVSKGKVTMGSVNLLAEQENREPADMSNDEEAEKRTSSTSNRNESRSKNNLILIAAITTIIVWFCIGMAFICCRFRNAKGRGEGGEKGGRRHADRAGAHSGGGAHSGAGAHSGGGAHSAGGTGDSRGRSAGGTGGAGAKSKDRGGARSAGGPTDGMLSGGRTVFGGKAVRDKPKHDHQPHHDPHHLHHEPHHQHHDLAPCNEGTCPAFDKTTSSTTHTTTHSTHTTDNSLKPKTTPSNKSSSKKSTKSTKSYKSSNKSSGNASRSTPDPDSDAQSAAAKKKAAQIQVHSVQYYPPTFACHTSMTGKVKLDSSTEEYTSRDEIKRPYVFGYDFQTTSDEESSPRDPTSDGENEMVGGNMSK